MVKLCKQRWRNRRNTCCTVDELSSSGLTLQEDDFRFLVEPGKRRWRNWGLRVALWVGVNLMLLGVIALLVGHLTAPRQPIVHQQDNFTVLDRWAVAFNNRLVICQLAGMSTMSFHRLSISIFYLSHNIPST